MKITIPKGWRIVGYSLVNHTSRCEPQKRVEVFGDSVYMIEFDRHNDEPEIPLPVVHAATKLAEFRKASELERERLIAEHFDTELEAPT